MEGHFHEDIDFSNRAKYLAKNIELINEPLYYFYQRNTSTSRGNKNPKRAFDCLAVARSLHDFTERKVAPCDKDVFGNAVATAINIGLSIIVSVDQQTRNKYINELKRDLRFTDTMKYAPGKFHRLEAYLLSFNANLLIYLYAKIKK